MPYAIALGHISISQRSIYAVTGVMKLSICRDKVPYLLGKL